MLQVGDKIKLNIDYFMIINPNANGISISRKEWILQNQNTIFEIKSVNDDVPFGIFLKGEYVIGCYNECELIKVEDA